MLISTLLSYPAQQRCYLKCVTSSIAMMFRQNAWYYKKLKQTSQKEQVVIVKSIQKVRWSSNK